MASSIDASTSGAGGVITTADNTGILQLKTAGTTAVTVDASQNVGIGTTSPSNLLSLSKAGIPKISLTNSTAGATSYLETDNSGYFNIYTAGGMGMGPTGANVFYFQTNNIERMRIDSSGNVLIGTTNGSSTAGVGIKFNTDAAGQVVQCVTSATTNGGSTNYNYYSTGAAAYRFYVGAGGTVYATATTITGISDQRVKENIVDLDEGLDAVMALKPRKFDWKEGKGKDIKGDRGFIAQEFETVFPDMIEEWKDPAPEGEEPYKAVNANLIPTLVKAIQELKAIVDAQQQEINALKGVAL